MRPFQISIKKIIIILLLAVGVPAILFAQKAREDLPALQKEARFYRQQGLELQENGNVEDALTLYQKAIELDENYAVPYNDLGIIYESRGELGRAEEYYLKAIKIEPKYLSPYSNLALIYENKRDLEQASFYWQKRAELGASNDPWAQKARERLADIRLVMSKETPGQIKEKEVISLMNDVVASKSSHKPSSKSKDKTGCKPKGKADVKKDDKAYSREQFEKAKESFEKGDFAAAAKEALDAQYFDPANKELEKFIEEAQRRALLK
ncbi:MAG: tetratricopeptide repeat protein [Candidatus Omnitrophica bacterium]|nr:tetratricopeptide repeat protein [Candidatus Omnitrophota bacterium]